MNELDIHKLYSGCRVKYYDIDKWVEGEVTIIREDTCKVIFDDSDLDYTYYPIKDLEFVN